jgi:hypothetical protein
MWCVDPLLGKNLETMSTAIAMQQANKQMAVSEQWLSKHIPAEMNTRATIGLLLETVFSMWSALRSYKEENGGIQ